MARKYKVTKSSNNTNKINMLCNSLMNKCSGNDGTAIIYSRVSSFNQTLGYSLDSQIKFCKDYCDKNNFRIIGEYSEVSSAKDINKQLCLNNIIENNNDFNLVIYEATRLSRNIKDFINFMDKCNNKNIIIHFVQSKLNTKNNMDIKNIISNIFDGQIELQTLSTRIKNSINFRKLNKIYYPSIVKYGYSYLKCSDKTKKLVPNEREQNIISLIQKLYYGSSASDVEKLIKLITLKKRYIFDSKYNKVFDIEYGNMKKIDIANFLNSLLIDRRGNKWSGISVSKLIC